jgi:hypothetical protein
MIRMVSMSRWPRCSRRRYRMARMIWMVRMARMLRVFRTITKFRMFSISLIRMAHCGQNGHLVRLLSGRNERVKAGDTCSRRLISWERAVASPGTATSQVDWASTHHNNSVTIIQASSFRCILAQYCSYTSTVPI